MKTLLVGCVAVVILGMFPISSTEAQCTLTCPANITKLNDPNQCGAVATYPAPTPSGTCGTIVVSPASGSFFPVGTTKATGTSSLGGGICTFLVTVNDTQPPAITCPANVTASSTSPAGAVVTFPLATATDNCPGVTRVMAPGSGSTFPAGTSLATGIAVDIRGNTATCTFTVKVVGGARPFDFDGDGKADIAVYRQSTGEWFIRRSSDAGLTLVAWGSPVLLDLPVLGDYDGDGKVDVAIYRQSTGEWFIRRSSDLVLTLVGWGSPFLLDVPVTGDYNGDGKTDVAVYRRSTGEWFVMLSGGGSLIVSWGAPALSDVPVSATGAR